MTRVCLGDVANERKENCKTNEYNDHIVGLEHLIPQEITLTQWAEKIENTFTEDLKEAYAKENITEYTVSNFAKALLKVFVENQKLVTILFNNKTTTNFLDDILEIVYQTCKEKWEQDLPNVSQEDIEYASVFLFNGALGVINFWVKNEFDKDVEEIAHIIEQLAYCGLKKYIYHY